MNQSAQYSDARCAIGIDVGGTKCAAGLVLFPEGRVIARRLQPTRPNRGGDALLEDVVHVVQSLRQEAASFGVEPGAIGLGVAELVSNAGQVLSEATIQWKHLQVSDCLLAETSLPVLVDADVRAAARGEAQFGSGRGFRSFLYVTIGTGISASFVQNGNPYTGARGLTGTFASSRGLIPDDAGKLAAGPPLEAFAAGPALAARFAKVSDGFAGTSADVIEAAEQGNPVAQTVVDTAGRAVGAAIANLVNMLDPVAVVIGGGVGSTEGFYRASLISALREHIWSDFHRDLLVRSAELGHDAGILGAALAAITA
jgi:glucokinase